MSWFADLAGKAENLLNNLDQQTGAAIRKHNGPMGIPTKKYNGAYIPDTVGGLKKKISKSPPRKPAIPPLPQHTQRSASKQITESKKEMSPSRQPQWLDETFHDSESDMKPLEENLKNNATKYRRYSCPNDLEFLDNDSISKKLQKLQLENSMLKNEKKYLDNKMCKVREKSQNSKEDSSNYKQGKFPSNTNDITLDYLSKIEQLQNKVNLLESSHLKMKTEGYENELQGLKSTKIALEDQVLKLEAKLLEAEGNNMRLDSELRHIQASMSALENDLERSKMECRRLDSDWKAYKVRVKNMLHNKDQEIKRMQEGVNLNEDSKALVAELETVKQEREKLRETVACKTNECENLKCYQEKMEKKCADAERTAAAVREALREERSHKNKLQAEVTMLNKELKKLEYDHSMTMGTLKNAIRDKEAEIKRIIDSSEHSLHTTNTGDLNVGDYNHDLKTAECEKIQYLSNVLIQKQSRIEALIADNNTLRIQLDKLETKIKNDQRINNHVVQLHDNDCVRRQLLDESLPKPTPSLPVRCNMHPPAIGSETTEQILYFLLRINRKVSLHLWVFTVLLSSTPEGYNNRRTKR